MRRLVALAAVAVVAGCGGDDELTRAEAQGRASAAVQAALRDGSVTRQIMKASIAADESMNRDAGVPLGSGVEKPVQVTVAAPKLKRLESEDGKWLAAYAVAGSNLVICVTLSDDVSRVAVRARC